MATATVALHFRDPHVHGSWGYCPSLYLFGVYCPFCGGLRAVNDLSNADLGSALHSNLLFVGVVPLILLGYALWVSDSWSGQSTVVSARTRQRIFVAFAAIALLFAVARNLSIGAPLRP